MSIAIARVNGPEAGYEVVGVSDPGVFAGFDSSHRVLAGYEMELGVPVILQAQSTIMLKQFGSVWLHTIGAMEQGGNDFGIMTVGAEITKIENGEYAVSDGLLVLGFVHISDLQERSDIFGFTLENGQKGKWK